MNNVKIQADVKTITAQCGHKYTLAYRSKAWGYNCTKAAWVKESRESTPWSCSCTAVFMGLFTHSSRNECFCPGWLQLQQTAFVRYTNLVKSKYNLFLSASDALTRTSMCDMTPFSCIFSCPPPHSLIKNLHIVFSLPIWFLSVLFKLSKLTLSSLPAKSFCHWQLQFM